MAQRGIREQDVRHVAEYGVSHPDASAVGAAPRTRVTGMRNGRVLTVVVAHEPARRVVITVFQKVTGCTGPTTPQSTR